MSALARMSLFVSRAESEKFAEQNRFEDKFQNGVTLHKKGEWNYFYSQEFFSVFTEGTAEQKITELVVDLTTELDLDLTKLTQFMGGKATFVTKEFNLRRKLY